MRLRACFGNRHLAPILPARCPLQPSVPFTGCDAGRAAPYSLRPQSLLIHPHIFTHHSAEKKEKKEKKEGKEKKGASFPASG